MKSVFVDSTDDLQKVFDDILSDPVVTDVCVNLGEGKWVGQFYFDGDRSCKGLPDVSIRIVGKGEGKTVISGSLYGLMPYLLNDDGSTKEKRGTFRSYTLFLGGPKVSLESLTIENTAGLPPPCGVGKNAGQAVALYSAAKKMYCRNVSLLGFQDTLFMSPLPFAEREVGGFNGPEKDNDRCMTEQFYDNCRIDGTIDFIFGGAKAVFYECSVNVLNQDGTDTCYIAAPNGDEEFFGGGFIFYKCRISGDACGKVYLARPWRPYAKCAYIMCELDEFIDKAGWDNWRNPCNEQTVCFAEYGSVGKGALRDGEKRAFGKMLSDQEGKNIEKAVFYLKNCCNK